VLKAQLYHSNRKQGFTFELEDRVVIEGFVNEINNKLCVVPNARTLRIKKQNRRAEGTTDMNKRMNQHWDPFRLSSFRDFGRKTFEILFVMVVPLARLVN
jgi:hypothetical protein